MSGRTAAAVRVAAPASSSAAHSIRAPGRNFGVQSKLNITQPGDAYELEADRVAATVTTAGSPDAAPPRITPLVRLARATSPRTDEESDLESQLELQLRQNRGRGNPLPARTLAAMERRFGFDFSRVRIHSDAQGQRLAQTFGSLAFTQSKDIYFADGQYRPGTPEGDRLLAHELTHVVQQGGGAGDTTPVQRAGDRQESKGYYSTYVPYPLLGGPGPLRGAAVHTGMQQRLRGVTSDLITEAPIPGGTTSDRFIDNDEKYRNFILLGRADLYMSSSAGTISGVRGELDDETLLRNEITFGYADRKNSAAKRGKGRISRSPRLPSGKKFKGTFPSQFFVADLKPLGVTKIGEGIAQIQNYIDGFTNFAARAHHTDKVTDTGNPSSIKGGPLRTHGEGPHFTIPEGLDYRNIDRPGEENRANRDQGAFVVGDTRYWLAPREDHGLYLYFHLPRKLPPHLTPQIREVVEGTATTPKDRSLDGLKRRLRDPDPGMPSGIDLSGKARPGASHARIQETSDETVIQTKKPEKPRDKKDWKTLGTDWQRDRNDWKRLQADPFLASDKAKALERKKQIDGKLGGSYRSTSPTSERDQSIAALKSISLWAGVAGATMGRVRFALGDKFDALADFFENVRTRFKGAHTKTKEIKTQGRRWKAKLFGLIVKAVKDIIVLFLEGLFDKFVACINAMIAGIIKKFTEDLTEELEAKLKQLEVKLDEQKAALEAEFNARFGELEELLETLKTGKQIIDAVSTAIDLIRAAVQIVACVSPPALGCLWGLVGQLAIEVALDLVVGTQAFRDEVINPIMKDLFGNVLSDTQKKIVAAAIPDSLKEYTGNPTECEAKDIPGGIPQLPPGARTQAEYRKLRDDWEATNRDKLLEGIRQGTDDGTGNPPENADIEHLVEVMKKSGLSQEELESIVDKTPHHGKKTYIFPLEDGIGREAFGPSGETLPPSSGGEDEGEGEDKPKRPPIIIKLPEREPGGSREGVPGGVDRGEPQSMADPGASPESREQEGEPGTGKGTIPGTAEAEPGAEKTGPAVAKSPGVADQDTGQPGSTGPRKPAQKQGTSDLPPEVATSSKKKRRKKGTAASAGATGKGGKGTGGSTLMLKKKLRQPGSGGDYAPGSILVVPFDNEGRQLEVGPQVVPPTGQETPWTSDIRVRF